MSLKAAIAGGVSAAFNALGDLKTPATYYKQVDETPRNAQYNPETGNLIVDWDVVMSVQIIRVKGSRSRTSPTSDTEWNLKPGQETALMESSSLTFRPRIGDQLEFDGSRWSIEEVGYDPSELLYILPIRNTAQAAVLGQSSTRAITGP